jgi:hypothetical protein
MLTVLFSFSHTNSLPSLIQDLLWGFSTIILAVLGKAGPLPETCGRVCLDLVILRPFPKTRLLSVVW